MYCLFFSGALAPMTKTINILIKKHNINNNINDITNNNNNRSKRNSNSNRKHQPQRSFQTLQ